MLNTTTPGQETLAQKRLSDYPDWGSAGDL